MGNHSYGRARHVMARAVFLASIVEMASCRTTPPPEFHGQWKPVNHFADAPREIPLHAAYVYFASPLDVTLKGLLTRWAADTGVPLRYDAGSDYTLYSAVEGIRTADRARALAGLQRAYAAQGLVVSDEGGMLVVRPTAGAAQGGSR